MVEKNFQKHYGSTTKHITAKTYQTVGWPINRERKNLKDFKYNSFIYNITNTDNTNIEKAERAAALFSEAGGSVPGGVT